MAVKLFSTCMLSKAGQTHTDFILFSQQAEWKKIRQTDSETAWLEESPAQSIVFCQPALPALKKPAHLVGCINCFKNCPVRMSGGRVSTGPPVVNLGWFIRNQLKFALYMASLSSAPMLSSSTFLIYPSYRELGTFGLWVKHNKPTPEC